MNMKIHPSLNDAIVFDDGPYGTLAKSLYTDDYRPRFSIANPDATRALTPIRLQNLRRTRQAVIRLLRENIDTVERMSMFDMHVAGMHSLVLYHDPSLMLRIYVQPRGSELAINTDWAVPYLYHPHRYHFMCAALQGGIINQRYLLEERPGGWYEYSFSSQLVHGDAAIRYLREVTLTPRSLERIGTGEGYLMEAPEIHRVGFVSDPATGWCIVLFYEFAEKMDAPFAYSRDMMDDIPDRDLLYRKPSRTELDALIEGIVAVLDEDDRTGVDAAVDGSRRAEACTRTPSPSARTLP